MNDPHANQDINKALYPAENIASSELSKENYSAIDETNPLAFPQKFMTIYLYGVIIILGGTFLLISKNSSFDTIRLIIGITMSVGAIIAFIAALSRQGRQVQNVYHNMHALAMLVYGASVLLFCNSLETLISYTTFLFFFYLFSEIIFCGWIFNLLQKVAIKIVIVRALLGLAIGIGAVVAMNLSDLSLEVFGVLFILVGINILLYVPIMKRRRFASEE
jgi:uncharacterized membrane protein HdeD (DUF308 family)